MNRLTVSFWLVALLGAAMLTALWYRADRRFQQTSAELAGARAQATDLRAQLATAQEQKSSLEQRVGDLETEATRPRDELAAATATNAQFERQLAQATADLNAAAEMHRAMTQHIAGLERQLASARAAAVAPETIEGYRATIAELERKLAEANRGATAIATAGASTAAFATQPRLAARVLSVGPSNSFVVLDYGTDRGAAAGQRLSVRRGTEPVAEVLISDVREQLSIAHVRPNSVRGVLHKGDSAVLTP